MNSAVISDESDIRRGLEYLCAAESRFADVVALAGVPPLRLRPDGFTTLLDIIVSQQLSVASADAIWKRLDERGLTRQSALRNCRHEELRQCGLSRQKAEYARALAENDLDYRSLAGLGDDEVIKALVTIRGIGVWTAEIYAMSALGRADVLAAGDLALQESARLLFGLDQRPTERELRQMARGWSPWRAVAARLLWAYYRVEIKREGIR